MANQTVMADLVVIHSLRMKSILQLDILEKHNCIIDLPKNVFGLDILE